MSKHELLGPTTLLASGRIGREVGVNRSDRPVFVTPWTLNSLLIGRVLLPAGAPTVYSTLINHLPCTVRPRTFLHAFWGKKECRKSTKIFSDSIYGIYTPYCVTHLI